MSETVSDNGIDFTDIQQQVAELLDISEFPDEYQTEIIEELGEVLIDNTVLDLIENANEEDAQQLQTLLEEELPPDQFMIEVEKMFPQFTDILQREALLLKSDLDQVLMEVESEDVAA